MGDKTEKNIEDIQVGDEVSSFNETTKEVEIKKVIELKQPIHADLVKYTLECGGEITSTYDHPFYIENDELASYRPDLTNERYSIGKNVIQITNDMSVILAGGAISKITSIEPLEVGNTQTYIFTVEDNHNFYANSILVHNK
jgi:intein/homing endonuclease